MNKKGIDTKVHLLVVNTYLRQYSETNDQEPHHISSVSLPLIYSLTY